jgi:hypothetical protein
MLLVIFGRSLTENVDIVRKVWCGEVRSDTDAPFSKLLA